MTEKIRTEFGFGSSIEATFRDGKIEVVMTTRSPRSLEPTVTSLTGSKGSWRVFARWLLDPDGDPFEHPKPTRYTVGMPDNRADAWRYILDQGGRRVGFAMPTSPDPGWVASKLGLSDQPLARRFGSPEAVAAAWDEVWAEDAP